MDTHPTDTPRRQRAGFTMVEVLISILVLTIGVIGVFAMQIIAVQANNEARYETDAITLAEHALEYFRHDGLTWNTQGNLNNTQFMQPALIGQAGTAGAWQQMTERPFHGFGLPVNDPELPGSLRPRAVFCIAYQLHWVVTNQVIGGNIRVFWPRRNANAGILANCGAGPDPFSFDNLDNTDAREQIGVYTIPFTVMFNPTP